MNVKRKENIGMTRKKTIKNRRKQSREREGKMIKEKEYKERWSENGKKRRKKMRCYKNFSFFFSFLNFCEFFFKEWKKKIRLNQNGRNLKNKNIKS